MARVKRAVNARKYHKKILNLRKATMVEKASYSKLLMKQL